MLRALKLIIINVIAFALILAVLEGGATLLVAGLQIWRASGIREQYHSTYDPTIGWVSLPNVDLPDLYGPGVFLRTNAQAFREDRDVPREVPAGKTRIICSGDSFTLGYGVSNDQTWCHRLATLDPSLETVNLGQGGYGLDQAYLWYKRAGAPLDHQVQLLAFITDDFQRMEYDNFVGYGKPLLGVRGDSIVVLNYPVQKRSWVAKWWLAKGHVLMNLNFVRVTQRIVRGGRVATVDSTAARKQAARDSATQKVVARIFQDLAQVNRAKQSRLVLVYLPGMSDYLTQDSVPSWHSFVTAEAARQGIPLLDLFDPLRRVPPTQIERMFLPDQHYSARGNEFVARTLAAALPGILTPTAAATAPHPTAQQAARPTGRPAAHPSTR